MAFIYYFLLGWMFLQITASQDDESISFSPTSKSARNSYWYGNITIPKESSLIEEGIHIKLHLNQFQGLLFYAIDSNYRTLWVEFIPGILEISHYNFKISEPDKRSFKLLDLCIHISDNKINLKFSFKNNEIVINCNGNSQTIDYVRPSESISKNDLDRFIENMILPVPIFDDVNSSLKVYLWIGNTPFKNDERLYRNTLELKSNRENLWGCINFFAIKDTILKLATIGDRIGEMIEPFCKPVCNSNSCYNHGKCHELWRGRFSCDCGFSRFIGDRCNLEYSVKFNGSFSFEHSTYFKFQKLQFSFKPIIDNKHKGHKILSLKFLKNQSFQVYIDTSDYFHARFVKTTEWIMDEIFRIKMMHNKIYMFFIEVNMNEIQMKLFDSQDKSLIDNKIIRSLESNIVIEHILISDSHSSNMNWMKKFEGCLTNLMLKADSRKFVWNDIKNFTNYPNCKEIIKTTTLPNSNYSYELRFYNKKFPVVSPAMSNDKKNIKANNDYMIYVIIVSLFIIALIIVLIIVILLKYKSFNPKPLPETSDKIKLTNNCKISEDQMPLPEQQKLTQTLCNSTTASLNTYPSPIYMTFKPAYKARSITSSITNRSIMSLPNATTPTLVTPEDGEML